MKLTENNSKFAVVRTAFHGGGFVKFTNSLNVAKRILAQTISSDCTCGCADIVPVTEEGASELLNSIEDKNEREYSQENMVLYKDLPTFDTNLNYGTLCK